MVVKSVLGHDSFPHFFRYAAIAGLNANKQEEVTEALRPKLSALPPVLDVHTLFSSDRSFYGSFNNVRSFAKAKPWLRDNEVDRWKSMNHRDIRRGMLRMLKQDLGGDDDTRRWPRDTPDDLGKAHPQWLAEFPDGFGILIALLAKSARGLDGGDLGE